MANKTSFLKLILPNLGEFFNKWNTPVNSNFSTLDAFCEAVDTEISDARGVAGSLADRLDQSLNPDGSLKDAAEVVEARSSKVYGSGTGSTFQSLDQRLEQSDDEIFKARQGVSSLLSAIAFAGNKSKDNSLVSGPNNPLTFSGAVVTLNGGVTKVVSNINGYRNETDFNDQVTISGAAGTYHLYLDRNPNGRLYYTTPVASGSISTLTSTGKLCKFKATGTNLVTSGVKPGHILEITLPGANLNVGKYIILETNTENPGDLANDEVRIVGEFVTASTGLTATFTYQQTPTLGFTGTAPSPIFQEYSDRIYIGRCVFDGTNVTSIIAYPYQGIYAAWHQVTPVAGDFSLNISHNLGFVPRLINVYGSTANDLTQPLELMSVAKMTQGSVSLNAGDQTVTYTPPALRRSIVAKTTDTVINIKNATNGVFFEDYNGSLQTSGYVYVIVER